MDVQTGMFNHYMNPEQLRMKSFASTIARIYPNGSSPLFALTGQSGRAKAKQIEHGYFSKTWKFKALTVGAEANVAETTLTLQSAADNNTSGIVPKQMFYNTRTREVVRITSVTSAQVLVVERSVGRVAAAAINATDRWVQIGTAFEQGSGRPEARSLQTEYFKNYTQIFRNAWALTDTARASYNELGYKDISENRRDCSMFHSQDMEMAMLFGQKSLDTSGNTPISTTQGLVDAIHEYAPQNVQTAASTTSYDQLEDMLLPAFQQNTTASSSQDRLLFTGSVGAKVLQQIGRNHAQAQMTLDQTTMGMRFASIKTFKGMVHIVEHPLLNGYGIGDMAIVLDIPSIKLAYMEGRDTKAEEYGVGGAASGQQGIDAQGGSLTSECAVEFLSPFSCGLIYGLTEGVA